MNSTEQRPLVLFAHGKESGPWGSKIRHLAEISQGLGAKVLSPDYSGIASPDERVAYLLSLQLPPHSQLILVGSSMGSYVSTVASAKLSPAGLFLMAPVLGLLGHTELHVLDVDHRLNEVLPEVGQLFESFLQQSLLASDLSHNATSWHMWGENFSATGCLCQHFGLLYINEKLNMEAMLSGKVTTTAKPMAVLATTRAQG